VFGRAVDEAAVHTAIMHNGSFHIDSQLIYSKGGGIVQPTVPGRLASRLAGWLAQQLRRRRCNTTPLKRRTLVRTPLLLQSGVARVVSGDRC
jgi:hypothetical protein